MENSTLSDTSNKLIPNISGYSQLFDRMYDDIKITEDSNDSTLNIVSDNSIKTKDLNWLPHLHSKPSQASLEADHIVTELNQSMDSFDSGPSLAVIEKYFINWVCEKIGFVDGDGTMTTGATESCMMAMIAARDAKISQAKTDGINQQVAIICSEDAHFSVEETAKYLGFGTNSVYKIKSLNGVMSLSHLNETVKYLATSDIKPMMIVATAGTTKYGTFDNILKISEICKKNNIWLHVDGAAGGAFAFADKYRYLVKGIESADSIAIDGHKLLSQTIPCGMFLTSSKKNMDSFYVKSDYLNPNECYEEPYDLVEKSMLTTRRNESLKLWHHIRTLGETKFSKSLDDIPDIAKHAGTIIDNHKHFELLLEPVSFSVVFRHKTFFNKEIPDFLFKEGNYVLGKGTINEQHVLRFTITTCKYADYNFKKTLDCIHNVLQESEFKFEK